MTPLDVFLSVHFRSFRLMLFLVFVGQLCILDMKLPVGNCYLSMTAGGFSLVVEMMT